MTTEQLAALDRIMAWITGAEDGEYDIRTEVIPLVFRVHDYDKDGNRTVGAYDAQSHRFKGNAPEVYYRASFLFGKVAPVDYKGLCVCITSPDQSFVASLDFFKYELGLYLAVAKEHLVKSGTNNCGVISGSPGSDNGTRGDDLSTKWFETLVAMLERRWMVYAGNNFEV